MDMAYTGKRGTQDESIADACLEGSHAGTLSFPQIVMRLGQAGFEGYAIDYRARTASYYREDGSVYQRSASVPLIPVAPEFEAPAVAGAVRWAQSGAADYSYDAFSRAVMMAGCAGYLVSFPGRRVLYYGRTGETHIEHFPA